MIDARDEMPSKHGPRPTVSSHQSAALTHHDDIFFAAVETTRMPTTVTDPHQLDNPVVFANNAFIQMTGYAKEQSALQTDLARDMLEGSGYDVTVENSPRAALGRLDAGEAFDLPFSDLVMPGGMNGTVLAREARRPVPKLEVLLTTGYAETSLERSETSGSEFELINKPYSRQDLVRRVRIVLDGPTGVA